MAYEGTGWEGTGPTHWSAERKRESDTLELIGKLGAQRERGDRIDPAEAQLAAAMALVVLGDTLTSVFSGTLAVSNVGP